MKKAVWMSVFVVALWFMMTAARSEEISYQWAYQGNVAFFEQNGKIGLMDREGHILHSAAFDSVMPFDEHGLAEITIDGKIGRLDSSGRIVIEPIVCSYMGYIPVENGFTELHDEAIAFQDTQRRWGFYSLEGDLISEAQWEDTYGFANGFAYVKKNGLWNMLDRQGRLVLEEGWDSIDVGRSGAAALWSAEKGIDINSQGQIEAAYRIDADGEWHQLTYRERSIAPYERMYDLQKQQCAYQLNGLYGVMNAGGSLVTQPVWKDISTFAPDDLLCVRKDSLYGWIDRTGKAVLECQWKTLYQIRENRWLGQLENGENWILDDRGRKICMIGTNFAYAIPREDGYIEYATRDGYWGFYDGDGKLLSRADANEVRQISLADYSEGWIQVELNDQSPALMRVDGTILSSERWTYISPFYHGYAVVGIEGREGFVDETGSLIHPAIWEDCGAYAWVNGQLIAPVTLCSEDEKSYINEEGKTICGVKLE